MNVVSVRDFAYVHGGTAKIARRKAVGVTKCRQRIVLMLAVRQTTPGQVQDSAIGAISFGEHRDLRAGHQACLCKPRPWNQMMRCLQSQQVFSKAPSRVEDASLAHVEPSRNEEPS